MTGRVRFRMSGQLLHDAMHLPDGVTVVAAEVDAGTDMVEFTVAGDGFPEVEEGAAPTMVHPVLTRSWEGDTVQWDWGI